MQKLMDRVFERYGTNAILVTAEGIQRLKVFFGCISSKSWYHMQNRYHELGRIPRGQYICRFPRGTAVRAGDSVRVNGALYQICRVEDMFGPGGCAYRWALCTLRGGGDNWGQ